MTPAVSIRREAAISFVINGVLSLAFFLGVFGTAPRPLGWMAPDNLALDFVPQSIAVALMSALVPALIARKRLGNAPALRPILIRAALFALAGAVLGGFLAFSIGMAAFPAIGWAMALMMKIVYGGALGVLVATLALRQLVSSVRTA
ncbi:hypothetical protein GCM10007897_04960 [Sphingobium jiangsuense]|uniref:Putative MnhB-related membrane protein n=1 Tax=Sphingobium jiangsuense TaxID=870476 RepID=A0A7W6FP40_9SPHN|nr:hypothetical protein [Sphingobium jiangsuense]MBB3925137.1 putative MnhB-related membrane protein [Sphingobium jiangsuense]GLS99117.1 hypothetical protein GCM10007897_04960 [Sphingobium jiangsuense]